MIYYKVISFLLTTFTMALVHQVNILNLTFVPSSIFGSVGDQVVWNFLSIPHSVVQVGEVCKRSIDGFDSKMMLSPQQFSLIFDRPGTYLYVDGVGWNCAEGLRGRVIIQEGSLHINPVTTPTSSPVATPTIPYSTLTQQMSSTMTIDSAQNAAAFKNPKRWFSFAILLL